MYLLSSILNSKRAIAVNIKVVRVYNKLKEMLLSDKNLLVKMEELESRISGQDDRILQVLDYLNQYVQEQEKPRKPIGFKRSKKKT